MLRNKVVFVLFALYSLTFTEASAQCGSSTLYSKSFAQGGDPFGSEVVTLDLSGFAGTTVALNFNSVVPECYSGPGDLFIDNVSMNGTCLPSDFIFTSAFGDINPSSWGGCSGSVGMDGCPSGNTPVTGTMSVSVPVPLGQENILTFNLEWFVDNGGGESRLFSITTGSVSSTLYSKSFAQGGDPFGSEVVTLDLSGFAGTTVALNFNSVVPECYSGPGDLFIDNVSMNGTCLPSDFIFTSAFGDINPSSWGGCSGSVGMDGCPSGNTPVTGTMSVSVPVPLGQENILTFNLEWFVDNGGGESRLFSITTGSVSSTLYSKSFAQGGDPFGSEVVTLDLSGFAGTTVALNFNSVVPECYSGPGDLFIDNVSMNGTCLPSDFIFTSAFGDINPSSWGGCSGSVGMDGCPSGNTPVTGTMSVSVPVPLGQENILTFNLEWFVDNGGGESRLFSITTGCSSESVEAGCTDSSACNFDVEANFDDGSCLAFDECGICGGNNTECADCCGVPNGDGSSCDGTCGPCGLDIPEGACDCDGNVIDECGVCGGTGIPEGACDCEGNVLDECGVCGGTGIPEGFCDCDGNVIDECGVCGGTGIPSGFCDCAGNTLDNCGVCGGDNSCCPDLMTLSSTVSGCSGNDGTATAFVSGCSASQNQALSILHEYMSIGPEMEYCIMANDPFMCMIWGEIWGYEMNNAMNEAGISYFDLMDALAVHSDNEALSILYQYMTIGPEMEYCIMANDPMMCEMWGMMWGYQMSDAMNEAGISYFDMMDALAAASSACTVSWSDAAGNNLGTAFELSGLDPGTYTASLTHTNGCTDVKTIEVGYSCAGCTDPLACNYSEAANVGDESCTYPETHYDCSGTCLLDTDGDGVCDELEVSGCTDSSSCTYDSSATDDDESCQYLDNCGVCGGDNSCCPDLMTLSSTVSGCSGNDGTATAFVSGCSASQNQALSILHEYMSIGPEMEYCIMANDPFMCMIWGEIWGYEMNNAMNEAGISYFDLMDALAVHSDNEALSILYQYMTIGPEMEYCIMANDPMMCEMWGMMWGYQMSDAMNEAGISYFDMMDALAAASSACTVSWSDAAGNNLGTAFELSGLDPGTYTASLTHTNGCTDVKTIEVGYSCAGCTDPLACNYSEAANVGDESCTYPETHYDCSGTCLLDTDGDGVCDELEVSGCTDSSSCTYDSSATDDDESCQYLDNCGVCGGDNSCCPDLMTLSSTVSGCSGNDGTATAFVSGCSASQNQALSILHEYMSIGPEMEYCIMANDPFMCMIWGEIWGYEMNNAMNEAGISYFDLMDALAVHSDNEALSILYQYMTIGPEMEYCIMANDPMMCEMWGMMWGYQMSDAMNEAGISYFDMMDALAAASSACTVSWSDAAGNNLGTAFELSGLDPGTYTASLTHTNGCTDVKTIEVGYSCAGCTDPLACNYSEAANVGDESCTYPETHYDCSGTCLLDTDGDGVCDELEVSGCTDSSSCTYDSSATDDDESCQYLDNCGVCGGDNSCCPDLMTLSSTVSGCSGNDGTATAFVSGCSASQNQALSILHEYMSIGPEMEYCIMANDPFMCMIWGEIWGYEMNNAMNEAGISYFDLMDALAVHSDNEALSILYQYMTIGPEMEYCIMANDPMMCEMWGMMWGYQMSDAMNEAGISYFDMMDALAAASSACTVSWSDAAGNNLGTAFELSGLDPGTYTASLTHTNGCTDVKTIEVGYSCAGCTDPLACNYSEAANVGDESCTYPETHYDCSGTCLLDTDGDGVCDELEVSGCTDSSSCTYDSSATDDDESCQYLDNCGVCGGDNSCCPDLMTLSSTVSGCSGNDGTATAFVSGCSASQNQALSILHEYMSIGPEMEYCIMANDPFMCMIWGEIWGYEMNNAMNEAGISYFDLMDALAVHSDNEALSILYQYMTIGPEMEYCIMANDPMMCEMWGMMWGYQMSDAMNEAGISYFDMMDALAAASSACTVSWSDAAGNNLGTAFELSGLDPGTYTASLTHTNGCTDVKTIEVGYSCAGCTDPLACNYSEAANVDDGTCIYAEGGVMGCTYPDACNYNELANVDDGNCDFGTCVVSGCTYEGADNYNAEATNDNGSCIYDEALDEAFQSGYDSGINDAPECPPSDNSCPEDLNNDGEVSTADLLVFLGAFGESC